MSRKSRATLVATPDSIEVGNLAAISNTPDYDPTVTGDSVDPEVDNGDDGSLEPAVLPPHTEPNEEITTDPALQPVESPAPAVDETSDITDHIYGGYAPAARKARSKRRSSGNIPWRRKYYYLPAHLANLDKWTAEQKARFTKQPNQVKLILKCMMEAFVGAASAASGDMIVTTAKAHGFLESRIDSAVLFAYYRRVFETLGVVATYTPREDELAEESENSESDNESSESDNESSESESENA